ncbi:homoserine kinase [Caminibacter pacificus]|jgi:homoserine kinase|uniref:Homoserine kinase n=1 Tax=Caminibacter pacificus TaxID=1424653 RepID=A0AAJ4RD28_9BACT|nr:homoserine kinase [Caminibacter pacificus]QCI27738.1 homoserine kinase [Caminibacter pacificus]ROR40087.1 homoserine kinase [Caminibacter pacificus]
MVITVPATSANLGPGFDTLGLALNLRNEIEIKPSNITSIEIYGENAEYLRSLKRNFFVEIFSDIYKNLTGKEDKFSFKFNNKIPLSRGLGSSSAVIVAAITAAYEMAQVPYKKDKIINLALNYEPHPDNITPATLGGFCVAKLKKNRVYFLKKFIPTNLRAIVVIPNKPVSTAKSRNSLKSHYPLKDVVTNISSTAMITAAFFSEKFDILKYIVEDKIHQENRMKLMPELFRVREIALREGALMSTLSGSGSTFFNLAYKDDAYNIYSALKDNFKDFNVKILYFDNVGVKVYN